MSLLGALRTGAVLVMLGAAGACIWFSATTLVGDLYLMTGQNSAASQPASMRTLAAARMAVGLLPWSADAAALEARAWQAHDAHVRARKAQLRALRLAPGEWQNWQALFASALRRNQPAVFRYSQKMLVQLAPNSTAMNLRSALLGLAYWNRGDVAMHAFWRNNIKRGLKHWRETLLFRVYQINGARRMCKLVPPEPSQERYRTWCELAPRYKEICRSSASLTAKQAHWCRTMSDQS